MDDKTSAHLHHANHDRIEDIEPAVYSISRHLEFAKSVSAGQVTEALCEYVEELQDWAREHGHLVGHIKVLLESGGQCARISGTGHAVQRSSSSRWEQVGMESVELSLTAILIGPSSTELKPIAADALERAIAIQA